MRLRTIKGGSQTVQMQCLDCGDAASNAIKKNSLSPEALKALPPFDDVLLRDRKEREHNEWLARSSEASTFSRVQNAEWWANYNAYLETPEWKARRRLVLERDNYVCQGCLKARAIQAHHLTYAHLFDELLFELISICGPCHNKAHGREVVK